MQISGSTAKGVVLSAATRHLAVRVYETLAELHALRPAWDQLISRYPLATTFCTWEWLSCWWECFGQNHSLLTIAFYDSDSLVGLAPLSISTERVGGLSLRVLRLIGDGSGDSDNLDLPVERGYEREFAEAILNVLEERKKEWRIGLFNTLPSDSPVARCLSDSLRSRSWAVFEHSSRCSAVHLPRNWELYLRLLSSEDRKNLARYTRRLQNRYSVRINRCNRQEELPCCLEALFELHQKRWQDAGEPGTFSSHHRRNFYDRLSRRLLDRGWLEFWILELDGELAAAQFAFRYGDTVFQLQEGYDHKRSADRPGYVLRGAVLEQLIRENVRTYDFLGGEDVYKSRWGARPAVYRNLHFAPGSSFGAVWLECVNQGQRAKEQLRSVLPAPIFALLRKTKSFALKW